ncbi:MAG TPA: hypothetical protein VHW23_19525 [Kofleriaceae bacterium]|nr:hypothetical protein [Kofleriaceae bacterium]
MTLGTAMLAGPASAETVGSVEPIIDNGVIDTAPLAAQPLDVRGAFAERLVVQREPARSAGVVSDERVCEPRLAEQRGLDLVARRAHAPGECAGRAIATTHAGIACSPLLRAALVAAQRPAPAAVTAPETIERPRRRTPTSSGVPIC